MHISVSDNFTGKPVKTGFLVLDPPGRYLRYLPEKFRSGYFLRIFWRSFLGVGVLHTTCRAEVMIISVFYHRAGVSGPEMYFSIFIHICFPLNTSSDYLTSYLSHILVCPLSTLGDSEF